MLLAYFSCMMQNCTQHTGWNNNIVLFMISYPQLNRSCLKATIENCSNSQYCLFMRDLVSMFWVRCLLFSAVLVAWPPDPTVHAGKSSFKKSLLQFTLVAFLLRCYQSKIFHAQCDSLFSFLASAKHDVKYDLKCAVMGNLSRRQLRTRPFSVDWQLRSCTVPDSLSVSRPGAMASGEEDGALEEKETNNKKRTKSIIATAWLMFYNIAMTAGYVWVQLFTKQLCCCCCFCSLYSLSVCCCL